MRRILSYLCLFIILCFMADAGIKYSIARQIDDQSPYCLSFASIGANLLESRLDCWAKIKTVKTYADMDQQLSEILALLDLPINEQDFQHQKQNGTQILRYKLNHNNHNYLFIIQTDSADSYCLITAISKDDQQLREDEQKLKQALNCKSYYHYQGVIRANLDKSDQEKLILVMIKSLQAQKVDEYENGNIISVTGYSRKLEPVAEAVQVGDKTYNFQLAFCRNRETNQTDIYLGIPLLLNDY